MKNHKINETRKRSFLKGITARILEIVIDTFLFFALGLEIHTSFGIALLIEGLCFLLHYLNERVWNKINYGRIIETRE